MKILLTCESPIKYNHKVDPLLLLTLVKRVLFNILKTTVELIQTDNGCFHINSCLLTVPPLIFQDLLTIKEFYSYINW